MDFHPRDTPWNGPYGVWAVPQDVARVAIHSMEASWDIPWDIPWVDILPVGHSMGRLMG